jgi:hypothetical protein
MTDNIRKISGGIAGAGGRLERVTDRRQEYSGIETLRKKLRMSELLSVKGFTIAEQFNSIYPEKILPVVRLGN